MNIKTHYVHPPIPTRNCDWCAVDDDVYDGAEDAHPSCRLVGYGATEQEAIADLILQTIESER